LTSDGDDREHVDPASHASDLLGADHQSPGAARSRNTRYRMSLDLGALDTDFLVLTDAGEHEFRFSGQAVSNEDKIRIEDLRGHVLYEARAHAARKQPRIVVVDQVGTEVGSVVRQPVGVLRDHFTIEMADGQLFSIEGSVTKHEFSIVGQDGVRLAEISRKWFRARSSYGVEIIPGQQDALLLATLVVLDQMIQGAL